MRLLWLAWAVGFAVIAVGLGFLHGYLPVLATQLAALSLIACILVRKKWRTPSIRVERLSVAAATGGFAAILIHDRLGRIEFNPPISEDGWRAYSNYATYHLLLISVGVAILALSYELAKTEARLLPDLLRKIGFRNARRGNWMWGLLLVQVFTFSLLTIPADIFRPYVEHVAWPFQALGAVVIVAASSGGAFWGIRDVRRSSTSAPSPELASDAPPALKGRRRVRRTTSLPEELRFQPRESFLRWMENRNQSSYVNNLLLTIAIAAIVLAADPSNPKPDSETAKWLRVGGIAAAVLSATAGTLMAFNRMTDFKNTNDVARRNYSIALIQAGAKPLAGDFDGSRPKTARQLLAENQGARNRARTLGPWTWTWIKVQIFFLIVSGTCLAAEGILRAT